MPVLPPAIWSGERRLPAGAARPRSRSSCRSLPRHRACATTWPMRRALPLIEHLAVAVAHAGDDVRQSRPGRHWRTARRRRSARAGSPRRCRARSTGWSCSSRMDAEPPRRAHHAPAADLGGELRRDGVDRLGQAVAERDLAAIGAGVVLGRPAVDGGRPVIGDRVRRIAALERGEIDEGLEGRARLARAPSARGRTGSSSRSARRPAP